MRFLMTTVGPTSEDPALFAEMDAYIRELTASGVLVATGGMEIEGTRVKSENGQVTVLDGPFTETKELAGGYAIVEVGGREEALALSRRFFGIVGDGDGHIQQLY